MSTPSRIQMSRRRPWRHLAPGDYVRIDRRSEWGNPFPVAAHGREEALRLFRAYLAESPDLVERARTELAGKTLACWCPPEAACHGDIWLQVANQETAA